MKLLEQLIKAARDDPAGLQTLLDRHRAELSPALAAQAREIFLQAGPAGKAGPALAGATVSMLVSMRIGDRYHGLESMMDMQQLYYMGAGTSEQYAAVRETCADLTGKAAQIGAADLAFRSSVLGADCAFFAFQEPGQGGAGGGKPWLLQCLNDLASAPATPDAPEVAQTFRKFVSLLTAAAQEAMELFPFDDPQVVDILARLAALSEQVIPADFDFGDYPADTDRTASILAILSGRHGSAASADARLAWLCARTERAGDLDGFVDALFQRYQLWRHAGASPAQMGGLRDVLLGLGDSLRGRFRSRAGRLWAGQELEAVQGELLHDALRDEAMPPNALLEAMDAGKARTLLDRLTDAPLPLLDPAADARAEALERQMLAFAPEDPAQETLVRAEMRLVSQLSLGTAWDRAERRTVLTELEALYAGSLSGFQGVTPGVPAGQVRTALQPGEVLIEYFLPHHRTHPALSLWVAVTTPAETRVVPVPLDHLPMGAFIGGMVIDGRQPVASSPLGDLVIDTRVAIQRGADGEARRGLDALAALLVAPVVALGLEPQDSRHWIIVPHGVLHYVPFAALSRPGGRWLIQDVALSVAPSASVWHTLQARAATPPTSFLGLADAVLDDSGLPPLKHAAREVEGIRRSLSALDCTTLTREAATEGALRSLAPQKSLIHVATHGEFPEEDAIDFHRVLLSATATDDGRVHAAEVRAWDLRGTGLFALSVCNGGLYRFGPGDEPYGLIEALLAAGARNVLGTLWPLEDAVGSAFMRDFYRHLLATGPAEALRQSSAQFIADGALIQHWAAFALVGPARPWPSSS